MTTKEYLMQIKRLKILIEQKKSERDTLADLTGVSGVSYDEEKVKSSPKGDAPFIAIIERRLELDAEIEEKIKEFIEKRSKIISEIQSVPHTEFMELLYKRYVEDKSLELISVEMSYSFSWLRHKHAGALRAFEKIFGKEYRDL